MVSALTSALHGGSDLVEMFADLAKRIDSDTAAVPQELTMAQRARRAYTRFGAVHTSDLCASALANDAQRLFTLLELAAIHDPDLAALLTPHYCIPPSC